MEVWRCGGVALEGVEVWRCGGVKVWRCEGVKVWQACAWACEHAHWHVGMHMRQACAWACAHHLQLGREEDGRHYLPNHLIT